MGKEIHKLRYWVQKVLPLVYDDSLSYYEVLSKVVKKINEVIDTDTVLVDKMDELSGRVTSIEVSVEELIGGGYIELIESYLTEAIKMVFFGLTDSGYFVAYIPDGWDDITFNTTEYDITVPETNEFGRLVLSY